MQTLSGAGMVVARAFTVIALIVGESIALLLGQKPPA